MNKNKADHLVYSTNPDWQPGENKVNAVTGPSSETIYLLLDRKGRRGKNVTVIKGLNGDLKPVLKELQKLCGSGGTVKNQQVEIQGNHRQKIGKYLTEKGHKVTFSGG